MENEELDNELIVNNDVPETSEENEQIETSTSGGVEEVQEPTEKVEEPVEEDIKAQIEATVKDRLARDRATRERKQDREMAKYRQLENVIKAGLGVDSLDEAISKSSEFYRGQGINIPIQSEAFLNERDAIILAKADAQDIIKCGEKEMEYEANRIASIPREKRTMRENVMFNELCKELVSIQNVKELKSKGYDVKVLESDDFREFSKDINKPITQVYEMYTKLNGITKQAPKSPGSAKTTVTNDEVKEFYTPEEARKFTEEDLERNPKLEQALERSMLQWGKKNS